MATRNSKKENTVANSSSVLNSNITQSSETSDDCKKEMKYTVDELAEAADKVFGVKPYILRAALNPSAKYTESEVKEIIKKFLKGEVK